MRRSYVTPSGAASLLACKLRVGFASEPKSGKRHTGSPATRLGTVCHKVLEAAARGDLGRADEPEWADRFAQAWTASLGSQLAELAACEGPRPWPSPDRWPFYAQRLVATKRVARELSVEAADPSFDCFTEDELISSDGTLRGQPDLIVRAPVHEVRDYKTGPVADEHDVVREDYALQVQLYAVLEHENFGTWPERGLLIPLPGAARVVDVEPVLAEQARTRVRDALTAYNASVEADEIADLGAPSPETCRYCEYAPHCIAFWAAWDDGWADHGLTAAVGTVEEIRRAMRGGMTIDIAVESGLSADGLLSVHGLDATALPLLSILSPGDAIALVGLRPKAPGHAEPGRQLRIGVALRSAGRAQNETA